MYQEYESSLLVKVGK